MGMGIHGEWQTCNDSLTIRECYFPNGYANDHRWAAQGSLKEQANVGAHEPLLIQIFLFSYYSLTGRKDMEVPQK